MCGLTGFIELTRDLGHADLAGLAMRMGESLEHRGPNDAGVWADRGAGVALAHRRLSILDLSAAGHQPMVSHSGRYVIAFNGEIYNHLPLRRELERGHGLITWRGHSDTETLLAAVETWGIGRALTKAVGMFALALWDREDRTLTLARDRIGEKPLYYGWSGQTFLFGSELKALAAHPSWRGTVDREALALFMRYGYVPTPWSIYHGIRKLVPGTYLTITAETSSRTVGEPRAYWRAQDVAAQIVDPSLIGDERAAAGEVERLLRQAVSDQMIADVPLGAFLSGGIDSSMVVALMQSQSARPVQTFSIGFHERGYNEAEYAKAVARHLGTDHTELYVTPEEARAVIPRLPTLYDEPFGDSSQIPTFLVSQLARRNVTVSLSGDGGDELFGGYNRYFHGTAIWNRIRRLPAPLRRTAAFMLTRLSPAVWDRMFRYVRGFLPAHLRYDNFGEKVHKGSEVLSARGPDAIYRRLVSFWSPASEIVRDTTEPQTLFDEPFARAQPAGLLERMMFLDLVTYLPDDILVKVDRAAMGVSLETRMPFLDHRVVEFAWQLPSSMKIRGGVGKWILRQVLYRYVPRELIDRPKTGFGIPVESWLRGPLRDWVETLLDAKRLEQEGYLHAAPIRRKWQEHLTGRWNWQYDLWNVLMFQSWRETQHEKSSAVSPPQAASFN